MLFSQFILNIWSVVYKERNPSKNIHAYLIINLLGIEQLQCIVYCIV